MRKKIYAFLALALMSLALAPMINLKPGNISSKPETTKWWDVSHLYNMDFALPMLGRIYYLLGISLDPGKVVVGREGWLYYSKSISMKRIGATIENDILSEQLAYSATSWRKWLKKNGVKEYRILIGPDKNSIYPEYLPDWAKHAPMSIMDSVIKRVDADLYINPINALHRAKEENGIPIYYKADTHWNSLGAWIAFNELSENLASTQPEIIWPEKDIEYSIRVVDRIGGDLARFQRIQRHIIDTEVIIDAFSADPIPIEQYDFESRKLLSMGGNSAIGAPREPLLVRSEKALNPNKVLWLRDSFGSAMAPFMAATFTETLQIHYGSVNSEMLVALVRKYKPDYVVVTAVERNFRGGLLTSTPPIFASNNKMDFHPVFHSSKTKLKHLSAMKEADFFKITGGDPYIVFTFADPVHPKDVEQLAFEINCANNADSIPVQLFWRTKNAGFSEESSIRFSANQGFTSLDASAIPGWNKGEDITDVRLDLASPDDCPSVLIKYFELGIIHETSDL